MNGPSFKFKRRKRWLCFQKQSRTVVVCFGLSIYLTLGGCNRAEQSSQNNRSLLEPKPTHESSRELIPSTDQPTEPEPITDATDDLTEEAEKASPTEESVNTDASHETAVESAQEKEQAQAQAPEQAPEQAQEQEDQLESNTPSEEIASELTKPADSPTEQESPVSRVQPHPKTDSFTELQLGKDHTLFMLGADSFARRHYFLFSYARYLNDEQRQTVKLFTDSFEPDYAKLREQRSQLLLSGHDNPDIEILLRNNRIETALLSREIRQGIVRKIFTKEQRARFKADLVLRNEMNERRANQETTPKKDESIPSVSPPANTTESSTTPQAPKKQEDR